jgi:integrase
MNDKPIGDLRGRMIADMTVRSFGEKTQHDYMRRIETFARFLGRSPDTATGDDIRRFQLAQVEQGAQPPKMNGQASALRFFFTITLGRADLAHQLARTHYPRKLPRVLAREQVARLIEAAPGPGLKYKTALSIAYGAGLRGGEVVMLRVGDIDSKRMLIRVELGKGRKSLPSRKRGIGMPSRLGALLDGASTLLPSATDGEPQTLSAPMRLRRSGREIRMLIDSTDPCAIAKPKAGLIKLRIERTR